MILQIWDAIPKVKSKALPCQAPPSPYSMQRCWHSAPWKHTKKTKRLCWVWTLCMVMCRIRPHSIVSCVFDVLISAFRLKDWLFKSTFKLDPSPMISGSFSNLEIMPESHVKWIVTLPETNSSHLPGSQAPKGNNGLIRCYQYVSFREGR